MGVKINYSDPIDFLTPLISSDPIDFFTGFKQGLAQICTVEKGLKAGRQGKRMFSSCPANSAYITAYAKGFKEYQAAREERQLNNLTRTGIGDNLKRAPSGGIK